MSELDGKEKVRVARKALNAMKRAEALLSHVPAQSSKIKLHLGNLYYDIEEYAEPVHKYLEAIKLAEEYGQTSEAVMARENVAWAYVELLDLQKAYEYAIALKESGEASADVDDLLSRIDALARDRGVRPHDN